MTLDINGTLRKIVEMRTCIEEIFKTYMRLGETLRNDAHGWMGDSYYTREAKMNNLVERCSILRAQADKILDRQMEYLHHLMTTSDS